MDLLDYLLNGIPANSVVPPCQNRVLLLPEVETGRTYSVHKPPRAYIIAKWTTTARATACASYTVVPSL
jgi:hypothetical protein